MKKYRQKSTALQKYVPDPHRTWIPAFLHELSLWGIVGAACQAAGIHRTTAYAYRERNPGFAGAWEKALEDAADRLEREAFRRAVEGVARPLLYKGKLIYEEIIEHDGTRRRIPIFNREYSDSILQLLLKGAKPDKYRERISILTDEQVDAEIKRLESQKIALDDELGARREAKKATGASEASG